MNRKKQFSITNNFVLFLCIIAGWLTFLLALPYLVWTIEEVISNSNEWNNRKETCKEEILRELKSPWSAIFWENRVYGSQFIKNYVDSQNSYWALLRKYFLCGDVRSDGSIIFFFDDDPGYNTLNKMEFGSD